MILFMSGALENENALDCLSHWIAPHCGFVGGGIIYWIVSGVRLQRARVS